MNLSPKTYPNLPENLPVSKALESCAWRHNVNGIHIEKSKPSLRKMTFESQETALPHWTGTARKKPRARSAIANGRKLIMADGRSMWAKRFIEICAGHCDDLGGFANLSQAEIAIIKRAATLQVELENLETRLANGDGKIDLVAFAQISNGMRRLLETVGIKRVPRDVTPTLAEILNGDGGAS